MRIAHLSDLHFCARFKKQNVERTKKLLEAAVESGADHVVITGDISDNTCEQDFVTLRRLLDSYNLYRWDRTSIVIGNHDIFGGVQTAQDVLRFPSRCAATNYHKRVNRFIRHFDLLFENTFSPAGKKLFPFAKVINNVVFFGVNSIAKYSRLKNPFASNGKIEKEEYKLLKNLFRMESFGDKFKIVLVHHHFYKNNVSATSSEHKIWNKIENYTMKLRGKKRLIKLFSKNKIDLVLHGHSHDLKEYSRKGVKFVNAGGSVDNNSLNHAGFYLIDINGSAVELNLQIVELNGIKEKISIPAGVAVHSLAG